MNNEIGRHETKIFYENGAVTVQYHATKVFQMKQDGNTADVVLNSGGWRTATTKKRINQCCAFYGLPFIVKQEAFNWFLLFDNGETREFIDGETVKVSL